MFILIYICIKRPWKNTQYSDYLSLKSEFQQGRWVNSVERENGEKGSLVLWKHLSFISQREFTSISAHVSDHNRPLVHTVSGTLLKSKSTALRTSNMAAMRQNSLSAQRPSKGSSRKRGTPTSDCSSLHRFFWLLF